MAAPSANESVIVVTGGEPISAAHLAGLPGDALVIAADSGVDHATALGLRVDVAVGDLDSVTPPGLERAIADGATIERHPEAKDETDLELALNAAVARRAQRVFVVGGHGGRLDHFLANALVLAAPGYAEVELVAQMGDARVSVVRGAITLRGRPGELVTLLAVHGNAVGVTTHGLRYPLADEDLAPGSTRGVSNRFVADEATVTLRDGTLLAVQPHHLPANPERIRSQ